MKQYYLLFLFLLLCTSTFAQSAADYAVQVTATVQQSPAQIQLQWKRITFTNPSYSIFRKAQNATSWGNSIATLLAIDSIYTDANVVADSSYEYQVVANGSITSYGYILAGINAKPIHSRGTLILLVDSLFIDSCKTELNTLMKDISGDGWQIIRHNIARTTGDTTVHMIIANDYQTYNNVTAALIIGHIAVPYSGNLVPDGHIPNHKGAWPADVYYANMDGPWTDSTVIDTNAGYAANKNIIGDGKWDQTILPSPAQLQVSRVDFYAMPFFTKTEVQLMKSYLNKDHQYKMDSLNIIHRALINDNFGAFNGEAFAANGWRNFPPLVGTGKVQALPFIATLNDSSYQWAYGCGGGTFTSASGVGSTTDFTTNNVNAIFTMTFGSYFGDWNTPNNFLRAPLCSNIPALTNCWAGRPNWFVHHMSLGENIGYSTLVTQNNTLYSPANYGVNFVHIALIGDLTLRTDYIKPPANLVITSVAGGSAVITWQPSPDAGVSGYYVYRADSLFGNYQLLNAVSASSTFTDSFGISGLKYYMVRPVKLTQTPSGTYYNLGIGITDTATVKLFYHTSVPAVVAPMAVQLYPNPVKDHLNLIINATATSKATIKISNITGQTLLTSNTQLINGKNTFGFDVQKFAPGTYIISINAGAEVKSLKWVKTD